MDHVEPEQPRWLLDLRAEVDRAFVVTGASTPGWPDPYPERDAPDSTYSQCAEPARYRILETRVDAWSEALGAHGLATVTHLDPADLRWDDRDRGTGALHAVRRLDPVAPDALSLVLATPLVDGAPFGVDLGVSNRDGRAAFVEPVPDCGCDHCDSGSEDLLGVLDEWVMTVARGGLVHVRHGAASMTLNWDGWQSHNHCGDDWLTDSATIPEGASVWSGEPWALRPRSAP